MFGQLIAPKTALDIAQSSFGASVSKAYNNPVPYQSYFLYIPANSLETINFKGDYIYIMSLSSGSSINISIDDQAKQNLFTNAKIVITAKFDRLTIFNDTNSQIIVNLILGNGDINYIPSSSGGGTVDLTTPFIYFGDPNSNGTWRITTNAGNLSFQQLVAGVWTEFSNINPS